MPPALDRLAFLDLCATEPGTYRAAALVTDRFTDPVEFRYTGPVTPTKLQRVLWGGRLTGHLVTHVVVRPLFDALTPPIALVVVRQRALLDLRPLVGCPVVQVTAAGDMDGGRLVADRAAMPGADGPQPVLVRAWRDDPADLSAAAEWLAAVAQVVHPAEVFQRAGQALAAVHKSEGRAAAG